MKKNMTIISLFCLFAVIILCSLNKTQCFAEEIVASAECGPECSYTLTDDGTLTISGRGTVTKIFTEEKEVKDIIKKIVVNEGIEKIGEGVFERIFPSDSNEWIEVVLPSSLQEIGKKAFFCMRTNNIVLPQNIKKIDNSAFRQTYTADEIVLPESIEDYGLGIFSSTHICKITFPSNMHIIPGSICSGCEYLKTIVWNGNVREIGYAAFSGCSSLNNIIIPDSVTKINEYAFSHCENMKKITIGKSVTEIPRNFISGCNSIKTIVNNSGINIPLDTLKGRRSWYVNGKKVTALKPGKTAKAVYQSYRIKYNLDGGKISGKRPKKHTYCSDTPLPKKVKRKGYVFVGWYIHAKNDWELFPEAIPGKLYGDITAKAVFKKYSVTSKSGRIKVTVKATDYGKKGYIKDGDAYYYRYSENEDMSDSEIVVYTAPYGKGLSDKLEKGKTYYVEITRYLETYMEDSEDYEEPIDGWHCKRKVVIR